MAPKPASKRSRGRPRGAPAQSMQLDLEVRQVQYLNAFRAISTLGTPTFISLVRQALDKFIAAELAKPGVRAAVEQNLGKSRRAGLKVVSGDKK